MYGFKFRSNKIKIKSILYDYWIPQFCLVFTCQRYDFYNNICKNENEKVYSGTVSLAIAFTSQNLRQAAFGVFCCTVCFPLFHRSNTEVIRIIKVTIMIIMLVIIISCNILFLSYTVADQDALSHPLLPIIKIVSRSFQTGTFLEDSITHEMIRCQSLRQDS